VDARGRLWERSGRPGGGAYPRQAGGPARSDRFRHRSLIANADPRRGDDSLG